MLTHAAASSASSLVAISSSQESSAGVNNCVPSIALLTDIPVTTASAILNSGRKKARKTNPGLLQRVLDADCEIVINPPSANSGSRKRSRKQKISILSDTVGDEVAVVPKSKGKAQKRAKAGKVVVSTRIKSNQIDVSVSSDCVVSDSSAFDSVKRSSLQHASSFSLKHELSHINFHELIDPKLSFKLFGDVSRNLAAISPSEVVVAVGTTTENDSLNVIHSEDGSRNLNFGNLYSLFKAVPHFLSVTGTLYARSEPLARILLFSQLEDYTCKVLFRNKVNTFRFSGTSFEKRLVDIPHADSEINKTHNEYRVADVIIKHPILNFYNRKSISLKFVILKRVPVENTEYAVIKARIVKLHRSADLKNIEIFVDESVIDEKTLDVNAMNQRNIQPVIQTPSGLVPVITNTNSYLQSTQSYQHQPQQYHYVQCQYQERNPVHVTLDDSALSIANSFTVNNNNNVPVIRTTDYPGSTIFTENGTQVLILNHSTSSSVSRSYLHQTQPQHIVQEGPSSSQLALSENLNVRLQLQSEQQQKQFQDVEHKSQYVTIPTKDVGKLSGQIIVDPSQLANLQSRSNVPIRIIQSSCRLETGAETSRANLYAPSLQELKLPPQHIQYEAQSQAQSTYITNLQQQGTSSVQIQQQLPHNLTEGERNIEQNIQYTFPTLQSTHTHQEHQYLQPQVHSIQQELQIQSQIQHISQQHHHLHQSVVPDLSALNPFKQSLASQPLSQPQCLPEPLPLQNFQHCSTSLASIQAPQQTSGPLGTPIAAPVRKQKGVKQPKRAHKKLKVAEASSHEAHSPPVSVSLSEQQLHQLQKRAKLGSVYEIVAPAHAHNPSGLLLSHSKSLTSTLPSSIHSSASSSPNPVLLNAPKSQDPSASSSTSLAAVPKVSYPVITSSQSTSTSVPKVISVIKSNTTKAIESPVAVPDNRPTKKEGYLAVCPRCGVCTDSLIKCVRCKAEFPADVRLVKDGFKVSNKEAAVLILKPVTSSFLDSTASDKTSCAGANVNNITKPCPPSVSTLLPKVSGFSGGRKIILVNKPAILGTVAGKEPNLATGTVHVSVQQDGGSAVTILSSNSKSASKLNSKPIPKKRAPPRKRHQELITLSSDDEESDSPSNVLKVEAKSLVNLKEDNSSIQLTSASTDQEASEATVSIPSTPNNMARKKGLAINLSPDMCTPSKRRKEEDIQDQTPEQIYDEISKRMVEPGCKFQYAMVQCRSLRIGSYKVTTSDTGFDIPVTFTELGIKFSLPHANFKHKQMKICIPLNVILDMTAHLHKKLPVIFISTGPKYARSVRDTLGLDGNPDSESSNFFCPQNGRSTQKKITLVASDIAEADVGIIKSLYSLTLNEIDYHSANSLLMSVTPDTYRGSISYSNDSPGSPPTPKIVSTTSVAPEANEQKSQNSAIISATSVVSSSSSSSTRRMRNCSSGSHDPIASPSTSSRFPAPCSIPVGNQDPGSAVLFYQGKNNVKMSICPNDISCLGHSQFLNDQIIDFWLAVIQTELLNDDDKKRTFVFDSFFYSKLTEKVKKRTAEEGSMSAGERRHARVKKRTKNVDIFEKDFLIVPINENYHWFIAIICFPGLQGYHDYNSLELLPNYKRMKSSKTSGRTMISIQSKSESTASYSNRDEAPEDPDEMESQMSTEPEDECSSPAESKIETDSNHRRNETGGGLKRESEFGQRVKHPCILIFDSLAGDARGRVFSTLREYLKIEYKTKKHADRIFDKTTMPGCMPKVPQQPNFSDCGLFLLQYVESFFSSPIQNFETLDLSLKNWFQTSIAENKRREIYEFILKKVEQLYPQNLARIPTVNFEPGDDNLNPEPPLHTEDDDSDDLFEPVPSKAKTRRRKSESDDHNYAKGKSTSSATTNEVKNE
ncbi:unnamed protein product [Orchesella dallaii]|uniref:Ubiquitin-like protease family profile domain-containing protein n=1 Tax=Orchesella dallaii TaxID=48710 RepID=A0ABP1Q784_9HEXA